MKKVKVKSNVEIFMGQRKPWGNVNPVTRVIPDKRFKKPKYKGKECVFLIQNIFPIIPKYIDHIDTVRNVAFPVVEGTKKLITDKVNKIFKLKEKGINLIFPDVDRISKILLDEIKEENG